MSRPPLEAATVQWPAGVCAKGTHPMGVPNGVVSLQNVAMVSLRVRYGYWGELGAVTM